jgi:hypothetical protein
LAGAQVSAADAFPASFGSEGEGAGEFREPGAVAVDNGSVLTSPSAGDVYVADSGNRRIEKFSPEGNFLLAWGWGVADGEAKPETCGPDATPVNATCRAGLAGAGGGQFEEEVAGVAVDGSSGPARGDVYVEDVRNHRVEKFSEDGSFLLAWGWGVADGTKELQACGPEAAVQTCQAGLESQVPGELGALGEMHPRTIAVGASGSVYVAGDGEVEEFSPSGVGERTVALAGAGPLVHALSVDGAGAIYVASEASSPPAGEIRKYSPSSGKELPPPRDPTAGFGSVIAVGPSNDLFVDGEFADAPYRLDELDAAGAQLASFASPQQPSAIATDEQTGAVYVLTTAAVFVVFPPPPGPLVEGEEAVAEPQGAVTVKASIDPEGKQTKYKLVYGPEESGETETAPVTMPAKEFEPETVEVKLKGLVPGATYHFHFVASNASAPAGNVGADETFAALPAVGIESESVAEVSARSARLEATLNPLGLPTEYHFEYDTREYREGEGSHGTSAPAEPEGEGLAGSGTSGVTATVKIEDLTPGRRYYYRVVAHNALGEVTGAGRTFTTQSGSGSVLIDGRGWELVSPPDKHGVALEAIALEGGVIQAAQDGSGLAYIAKGPVDSEPAGNRSLAEQQLLAAHGAGGWSTKDLATANETVAPLIGGELSEYRIFSANLTSGALEPTGYTPLSTLASERTPYLREASGEYVPFAYPGNVAEGVHYGVQQEESGLLLQGSGVEFLTATPDLTHVILSAPQPLVPGFQTNGQSALYEWSAGRPPREQLTPLSVLPGGASAAADGNSNAGFRNQVMRNAVSQDGSRVVFETVGTPGLFLRENERGETVRLDVPATGAAGGGGSAVFQDASNDDSRVFFTDGTHLTVRAGRSSVEEPGLYMCEVQAIAPGEEDCSRHLTDLTIDANPGEAADVLGLVIGSSEDGSYVYFVANGVLSNNGTAVPGAVRGTCGDGGEDTPTQTCNLYLSHEGALTLVAVLSGQDAPDWAAGPHAAGLQELSARVSPNGRYLAFMSQRSLTGYDNRDASSGAPDEEVFEYDAGSGGASSLTCASCSPSGARPAGIQDPSGESKTQSPLLVDRAGVWAEKWVAGLVPGWTSAGHGETLYQSRYLSDSGRLFFDSPDGLVSADGNGTEDVYEYEPEGVGMCTSGASSEVSTFKPVRAFAAEGSSGEEGAGCVGLISSGSSSEESAFLDSSEAGDDVFFLTGAKLSEQDYDDSLDVYDAHVCGAGWACPQGTVTVPPACTTAESCRSAQAPAPEVFGAPASATFSGPGNAPPGGPPAAKAGNGSRRSKKAAKCPRGKRRVHGRCVKSKKRAHRAAGRRRK